MAKNVVEQLSIMASGSAEHPVARTVLATIHQPSAEIFKLFDKVRAPPPTACCSLLPCSSNRSFPSLTHMVACYLRATALSNCVRNQLYFIVDGRVAYFGPAADVPAYFAGIGYAMPTTALSVPGYVMELVVDPADRGAAAARRHAICEAYTSSEAPPPRSVTSEEALAQVHAMEAPPFATQFRTLVARDMLMRRRTPILTKAILARNVTLSTLLGLILLRLDMSQTYVYSLTGSIFFGVASCVMPTSIGHISTLPFQLPIVVREVRSSSYSARAYYLAKVCTPSRCVDAARWYCHRSATVLHSIPKFTCSRLLFC